MCDGLILSLDIGQEEENCYWCVSRLFFSPGSIHKPFGYLRYISVHVCILEYSVAPCFIKRFHKELNYYKVISYTTMCNVL